MTNELREDLVYIGEKIEDMGFVGKTILITGATGLIGSFLVKAMALYNSTHAESVFVLALARNESKVSMIYQEFELPDIRFLYQELDEELTVENCDYVIHTASPTTSRFFVSNPVEVIHTIYSGTKSMLEFAKKHEVSGMVYLSSMEVFGIVDENERVSEAELGYVDLQNVRSCYSEGKRMAECMCNAYAKEYAVPVRTARLAQTFGAGVLKNENRVFAQFARSAVRGEDIVLHTTGGSVGNYVYLRDAVHAILLLLQNGENGEAYTIVNEATTMRIREMAQLVAENISNGQSKVVIDIPDGINLGYAPETKLRLSASKIRNLGWMPEVDLITAYQRMLPDLSL